MMGFAQCFGVCIICQNPFAFNPVRVPSVRVSGERQPICESCVERGNVLRAERGMEPIQVHADAYNACDERELI